MSAHLGHSKALTNTALDRDGLELVKTPTHPKMTVQTESSQHIEQRLLQHALEIKQQQRALDEREKELKLFADELSAQQKQLAQLAARERQQELQRKLLNQQREELNQLESELKVRESLLRKESKTLQSQREELHRQRAMLETQLADLELRLDDSARPDHEDDADHHPEDKTLSKASLKVMIGSGLDRPTPMVISLDKQLTRIGRESDCDVCLPSKGVSRSHCEIERRPDGLFLKDVGSRNGTLLNKRRIDKVTQLKAGDRIIVEHVELIVEMESPSAFEQELIDVTTSGDSV